MRDVSRSIRHLLAGRQRSAVAALEFALIAPTFIMAFAGVVDVGTALLVRMRLEATIAAGENYALLAANISKIGTSNEATLASNIATIVTGSTGATADATVVVNNGKNVTVVAGTATPGGTASTPSQCYCPTGAPSGWTWGSAVTCGSACTGGGTAGKFVAITASFNYTPFFASYGFVSNGAITAGALVQAQ
jgi:Flp pilus assembly protein TadG